MSIIVPNIEQFSWFAVMRLIDLERFESVMHDRVSDSKNLLKRNRIKQDSRRVYYASKRNFHWWKNLDKNLKNSRFDESLSRIDWSLFNRVTYSSFPRTRRGVRA